MIEWEVAELQDHLHDLLERVKQGEEVILAEDGEAVAVLVHPSKLWSRVRAPNTEAADELFAKLGKAGVTERDRSRDADPGGAEAIIEGLRSDWESRH